MLGEELNSSYVTERGLLGDRTYAVVDQNTGKVASAKNPRKWGRLFDFRSAFIDLPQVVEHVPPPVRITFPDGTHILSSNQTHVDYSLSKVFGRDVRLMKASLAEKPSYEEYWPDIDGLAQRDKVTDENMPSQTFFDIAVIHIMTTSTINHLRELYPEGRFEVRRFRPNIVIESSSSASGEEGEKQKEEEKKDFIENLWVGKKITISGGEDNNNIVLKVISRCTRCVMITLPQGDLPNDLGILRTVAKYNEVTAGVYASVHQGGGIIRRGDLVQIEEEEG
jgi:uncharacterized protein YcbX